MKPQRSTLNTAAERLSRRDEQDVLAAASRLFRSGFPNPDRIGCPSASAIKAAVRKQPDHDRAGVLDHLTCCSPCFVQYEALVHRKRVAANLKILALCAALVVTVALGAWFRANRQASSDPPRTPTIVQDQPQSPAPAPPAVMAALIDLRNRGPVRGEQRSRSDEIVATILPRVADLTVYLPVGSEEGRYEFQILRTTEEPVVTLAGQVAMEDRKAVLHVRVDLRGVEPGRYLLGLRKSGFRLAYYPISISP